MTRLEDLATEIILDILDLVPPEDLESLSLVSKRVRQAASPLLDEHRKALEEQDRVWDRYLLKENFPSHEHTDTLADLLCIVSTDQRLAKMVQALRVRDETWLDQKLNRGSWRPNETFVGALPSLRKSRRHASHRTRIQLLEDVVRQNDMVPEAEKDVWINRLRARCEATAILLLLCKLPALQNFQIDFLYADHSLPYHQFLRMLERILAGLAFPLNSTPPVTRPCQILKHVMITFDECQFTSIDVVRLFLSLPSISSLSCSSLVMEPGRPMTNTRTNLHRSTIKQLRFNDCALNLEALDEILPDVTSLENFTYAYYLSDDSPLLDAIEEFGYSIPNIHAALPIIASKIGRSLESLVLSTEIEGYDFRRMGTTTQPIDASRDLRSLKKLSVSTNLLLSEDTSDISKMASKLPASLESLVLHWIKRAPVDNINALGRVLGEFQVQVEAELPLLEELAVRGVYGKDEMKRLLPSYKEFGWHSFGHPSLCVHNMCDCTDWDTISCSDIRWRHLVGDPNSGTYQDQLESSASSDGED